jgi:PAS domain S-box-containing protein
MGAGCGPKRTNLAGPYFDSLCPTPKTHEFFPAAEVTLSRKRVKSRRPGRTLHSTKAKASSGRPRKTRADLERRLKACRREIAQARERLAEAAVQQTATSEMLRLISHSPIQSVLDAVAEHAARLCDASNARIWRLDNSLLRLVASYGESSATLDGREGLPVDRDTVTGRAAYDRRTFHVHDISAEDSEYPVGSRLVKGQGWHTTLATPLLREGNPIGTILVRRTEVRPFSDKQIALLETFADQAVIAIENVRLFEAEKQRALALAHANRDLAEREAKIRRLIDSNIIGIFIWDFDGRILEANDAFLRMVNYDREDLVSGRIYWTELTPLDWRDRNNLRIERQKSSGHFPPFEKEYTRKDGTRVPVLMGGALFEVGGNQGMAYVLDLTERKRADEALRENEYRLRQIIETVPAFLWSTAPDGEPTHISQRILDYSGMRFEDFKHLGWEAFMHPADFPETAKAFYHAIQTGTSYQAVHRLRRAADDEYRWYHARGEPLRDRQGNIIHWYGLSVDVEERQQAEDRLRRSEAYLAEAQRLSRTGTWVLNATTNQYLFWSDESYRIWAFDPLQGLPSRETVLQRIHPNDRDGRWEEIQEALRQKKDYSGEFRIVLPDGTVKYLAATGHHLFSTNGELVEAIGTNVDVTERKRAEQALRDSEGKFRDFAETASDWFWEIGLDYKFTLLTENAFGSDPAARIGTACWDHALDLETEPEKWRLIQETLDARKPFRDFVYCSKGRNGSSMYVRASGKPVFDTSGDFRGYRGTGTDVTAIIRAQQVEESLRTAQAELTHVGRIATLGQLTASIAHEVTQPIGSARNNARAALNFLDRQTPNLGEVKEALECVVADADRAGQIVGRIRDHIKKAPPRRECFDLNEAIDEVLLLARTTITENEVSVRTRFAEGPLAAYGDRVQLQQVVLNLVLNAVEAMASVQVGVRQLLISTEQNRAVEILVTIRDSGPGIELDRLERVFDAFYTTKSNGVGMGLSICRSIISAEGGRLWAEANKPRGAVFRFTVPNAEKS